MPLDAEQYDRMLVRAWKAVFDAGEVALNQRRHAHHRRLMFACKIINEIQSDVWASAHAQLVSTAGDRPRWDAGVQEQLVD